MDKFTESGVDRDAMFALIKSMVADGLLQKHIAIEDAPAHYEKIEKAILAYEAEKSKRSDSRS